MAEPHLNAVLVLGARLGTRGFQIRPEIPNGIHRFESSLLSGLLDSLSSSHQLDSPDGFSLIWKGTAKYKKVIDKYSREYPVGNEKSLLTMRRRLKGKTQNRYNKTLICLVATTAHIG